MYGGIAVPLLKTREPGAGQPIDLCPYAQAVRALAMRTCLGLRDSVGVNGAEHTRMRDDPDRFVHD
jgi:hypothetical protein